MPDEVNFKRLAQRLAEVGKADQIEGGSQDFARTYRAQYDALSEMRHPHWTHADIMSMTRDIMREIMRHTGESIRSTTAAQQRR